MSPALRRALPWLGLLVVLLLVGLVPYHALVDHVPWGPDAAKWVDRGTVDDPNWRHWVFSSKHFIGYRPVPALSFVLNELLTGYEPWGYRLTDLLLHCLVGAMLFDVHRRLTGERGAWGLVAVVLLLAHPATEEVVPFVARRSYLLQALFSLISVSLTLWALGRVAPWRRWLAWAGVALCTGLALLSNEGAFVVLVWLPLIAIALTPGAPTVRLRAALYLTPTALVAAAVLARRVAVLGSLTGGYGKHYFAFSRAGKILWRNMAEPDHVAIVDACIRYGLAPHGVTGNWVPGLREAVPLTGASLVLGLLLQAWRTPPPEEGELDRRWVGPLLLVWMGGAVGIVAASGTWFWRQGYFLLPPLGLALAMLAGQLVRDARSRRWVGLASLPALILVPVAVLATGPLLLGMNESANANRVLYGQHVHDIRALTADAQGPGTVLLALRGKAGPIHNVRIWSNRFGAERGLVFKVLARDANKGNERKGKLALRHPGGRAQLVIDGKQVKWETTRLFGVSLRGVEKLWLDRFYVDTEKRWLYIVPDGQPTLEPIGPPPSKGSGTGAHDR